MVTVPTACRDYKLLIQVIPQVIVRARLSALDAESFVAELFTTCRIL
jgi:hypothetical protein